MQHVGEFQQGIVIVAIAINSYCYGLGMLTLEALEAFYGHCGDATGIDGDSHDQHIFGGYLHFLQGIVVGNIINLCFECPCICYLLANGSCGVRSTEIYNVCLHFSFLFLLIQM